MSWLIDFRFGKALCDPWQMQAVAQRLVRAGISIEEFPQTVSNLTLASQNLFELIEHGNLVVYRDEAMRLAVSRCVAIEGSRGWRIAKEKQSHKIDTVVALAMACWAAVSDANADMRKISWSTDSPYWGRYATDGSDPYRREAERRSIVRTGNLNADGVPIDAIAGRLIIPRRPGIETNTDSLM